MKAILIGFAVPHPEHIKHMKAFIGNWEGSPAVIVMMPNPRKVHILETVMHIDEKMDVQLGTCSERNHSLCFIAGQFFKLKDDFSWIFHRPMIDSLEMTADHYFSNNIGNDWINVCSSDPNMLLIHLSPFETKFTLTGSDYYRSVTVYGHVIVAISGTKRLIGFNNTETQSHQSVDLNHMFGSPHRSTAGSQGSLSPQRAGENFGKQP